ncbi:MAG: energy-coupling factor transporter transmembrane protein EcfT [Actinobacteria bacterium]|nr:energy-coupling factor transporter transmembrane protein EcfT [Actinomycetota bacterium]
MRGFLDYVAGDSILHRLNPITKIILSLCICIACFASNNLIFLVGIIGIDLVFGAVGHVFDKAVSLLKGLVKISIFLFIIQVLFVHSGTVLVPLPFGLDITLDGVVLAAKVVLKIIGATMPLALLLSVTQMSDLSNALVKKLNVPYQYAFTFTTAIRFIPIFADEMAGIMEAQTSRGVEFDTKNIFKKLGLILPLCVPLLISSVKKINSSAIAAEVRGFHLRNRTSGYKDYPIAGNDTVAIFLSVLLVLFSLYLNTL